MKLFQSSGLFQRDNPSGKKQRQKSGSVILDVGAFVCNVTRCLTEIAILVLISACPY